jgi:ATP-dependent Clp protease ATP-binding subunit ClpC
MKAAVSNLLVCPGCHGQGSILNQRGEVLACPTCSEVGVGAWRGGRWWVWQHSISDFTILERRLERVVHVLVNGLLIFFVGLGALTGGRDLFEAALSGDLLATLVSRSWNLTAWWFGLLCACYLVYRLLRDWYLYPRIPISDASVMRGEPWTDSKNAKDISLVMTEESRRVLEHAWQMAKDGGRASLEAVHIISILTTKPEIASMVVRMGLDIGDFRERLRHLRDRVPAGKLAPVMSSGVRQLIAHAFDRAGIDAQERVTLPYLFGALADIEDPTRELLYSMDIDQHKLEHVIQWLIIQDDLRHKVRRYQSRSAMKPKGAIDRGFTAAATPVLDRYSTDLTIRARNGRLPYVVGREETLQKIFRIMESGRRSVFLVGDAGVGKTTILYALAERMAAEDVPEQLQDKRLVSLSAAALVSGAGGMGQMEERVSHIIDEITRSGNIILAIEDFDSLVGVSSSGGELDAARILADAVRRQEFLAIATAETGAYRRLVESSGVGAVFERVDVAEMSADEAIVAIESRIGPLEFKHKVFFTYDAIEQSVKFSQRYLHEKTLPGKALEILEEAATLARKTRGDRALVIGEDVAGIVSEQSHINVRSITADEQSKLLNLEQEIHGRVVGQEEAVKAVSNALRRARAEFRDTRRPISNLLFLGPTGVGKTELAKTVAAVYFGAEDAMIRLDMSEYQDVASIHRLIGSPSGTGGGMLTDAVRHKPFALVLLDELEKAHPDILNVFLQVMDDGRLTDASGRTIDFTNTIIIATSNAGTQFLQNRLRDGAALETIKTELMNQELQKYYRPEFLNRFDSIVLFKPLTPIDVAKIVALMVGEISTQLAERSITLKAAPEAIAELAQTGFDPLFGARPLRRLVQERVDNALATFLLQGKLGRRDVAILEPGGNIRVEKAQTFE